MISMKSGSKYITTTSYNLQHYINQLKFKIQKLEKGPTTLCFL